MDALHRQDIEALEWYIRSTYQRLKSIRATRLKVMQTYKNLPMSDAFYREIDRILTAMERQD